MPLTLTNAQATVVTNADGFLETAFESGVNNMAGPIFAGITQYTTLTSPQKVQVRTPFSELAAALVLALNLPGAFPGGASGTILIPKNSSGGTTGSITVVSGIITAF